MRLSLRSLVISVALTLVVGVGVKAQQAAPLVGHAPINASAANPGQQPAATPLPEVLRLAEVRSQAESAKITLLSIEADLSSDHVTATSEAELRGFTREINLRLEESSKILAAIPSIETLRDLDNGWQQVTESLSVCLRDVTRRSALMDRDHNRLTLLTDRWDAMLAQAQRSGPDDAIQPIEKSRASIRRTLVDVEHRQSRLMTLQNQILDQRSRVNEMRYSLQQARDEVIDRLFVRDSPPIWSAAARANANMRAWEENRKSVSSQITALRAYAGRRIAHFVEQALVIVLLTIGLYRARPQVRSLVAAEPELQRAALIFESPVATSVVLSVLFSGWIYPQAPRLLWAILGVAALVPTVLILRRFLEPPLFPILNALVAFYLVDHVRKVEAASAELSRLLFLGEFVVGVLFLGWLIRSERLPPAQEAHWGRLMKTIWAGARVALVIAGTALTANALGYVGLANYLGNVVLRSADLAAILYTAVRIIDGVSLFAMRVWPLNLLDLVRRHHRSLQHRLRTTLQIAAVVLWTLSTLEQLALRDLLIRKIHEALNARLPIDAFHITLGHILSFVVVVWTAFLLSRLVRFLLEEDIYPRVHLGNGVPYAISSVLHYVILLVGFYIAMAALGFDMTKFTILAGAFGVGFGFGLQNIVNNFVSGLILLFERPVKVGDVIQLGDGTGVVARIGIRASVIRMANGSEIILPNGQLISDKVTNWTFSNSLRSIVLPVSVESGADPKRVIELLEGIANAHPLVAHTPAPVALFANFNLGTLDFELQAWTEHFTEWTRIRSDLATTIHTTFAEQNIAIP